MESLKPILLLIVLSGIGYLVYVALNRAPPSEPVLDAAPAWNQPAKSESGGPKPKSSTDSRTNAPLGSGDLVTPPPSVGTPSASLPKSSSPYGGGSGTNALVTPPSSTIPAASVPPSSIVPPPVVASPAPAVPAMPAPINPVTPPPSNPVAGNPPVGAGPVAPGINPTSPPPNAAADLELTRQRYEFESSVRRAQSAIQQNQLVEALRELSNWYDHPAVPAERKQEIDDLLSQLAGTVVYSREHYLQQPYVVQQGETLDKIAEAQQVPWELLAKINGISNPNSLVVGEKLKVVRGPFHAQLNRGRNQLALFVDKMYAGRFDVQTAGDVAQVDGTFPVTKFAANNPSNSLQQPYISLGGNLFLRLPDGGATPQAGTMHIGERDLNDVFDILSDRSQVIIRR